MMDRISAYRELIRKNIDYENYPPIYNKQEVDELIELIVETLMLPPDAGTIRIGGKERPVPIVKSMFLKLDKDHICYILKCLHNTEKKKSKNGRIKKTASEKKAEKKSSLWIIALIAVILLILVGVVFLVLPKFRKEAAPENRKRSRWKLQRKAMLPEVGFQKKISAYTEYPGNRNSFWMQIHTACHRLKCRHMVTVLP